MTDQIPPLEAPHTALLVMDYQAGIVARVPQADQLVERARAAIDLVRDWGGQIGYVRVAFEDEDFDVPEPAGWARSCAVRARPSTPTRPPRPSTSGWRLQRATWSSARRGSAPSPPPTCTSNCRTRGSTPLVLAGISTSGVVLSTVIEAHDLDYRTFVLADGCADTDAEVHAFLLEKIFPRRAE